jgi:phage-related protein
MEFTVELYENQTGHCPVREFLDGLKGSDPGEFAMLMAGLAKLRQRQYHNPPLSKAIGEELFEMRHLGRLNTRVLYFFAKGRRIIAVHGIRNKSQKIPERDLKTALERKKDWQSREV